MPNQKLVEAVGKYIDKYYIPADDDITLDSEMKSIFDRISEFRQQRKVEKQIQIEKIKDSCMENGNDMAEYQVRPSEVMVVSHELHEATQDGNSNENAKRLLKIIDDVGTRKQYIFQI
jgi:hypothetical protein